MKCKIKNLRIHKSFNLWFKHSEISLDPFFNLVQFQIKVKKEKAQFERVFIVL